METKMALTKDEEVDEVDVTPKTSHLNAVKRIFKYLKSKPNLGLWYPRESSFDLEAYSDSDYARANLDRKSTTGGCQFLGSRFSCCKLLWTSIVDSESNKLIRVEKIKVDSLETELKQTKLTMGKVIVKLVKKVKKLEDILKRRKDEEPEDQGRIIQDICWEL
ncbi:hypothetical protein Tco_0673814 [Tanacetum coccineum]